MQRPRGTNKLGKFKRLKKATEAGAKWRGSERREGVGGARRPGACGLTARSLQVGRSAGALRGDLEVGAGGGRPRLCQEQARAAL